MHKTVLRLACPELIWDKSPTPLDGMNEEVLHTVLHYIYAECLPTGLAEPVALACIKAVADLQGFEKFSVLCETFLKNTALKQRK